MIVLLTLGKRGYPWLARVLLSVALVMVALFPDVPRLLVQVPRSLHPERLVDPVFPGSDAIEAELRAEMETLPLASTTQTAMIVAAFVERRITYAYDWELYGGNLNDWPTPQEVWQKRSDDCDGIAILTASILRRLGVPARLEYNLIHCWVEVPGVAGLGGPMPGPTASDPVGAPHWGALLMDFFRARTWTTGLQFPWWRIGLTLFAASFPWLSICRWSVTLPRRWCVRAQETTGAAHLPARQHSVAPTRYLRRPLGWFCRVIVPMTTRATPATTNGIHAAIHRSAESKFATANIIEASSTTLPRSWSAPIFMRRMLAPARARGKSVHLRF